MIDWLFAIFLLFAFILIILIIEYKDDTFWSGLFTILDIVMWFILASTVLEIESPTYVYNASLGQMQPTMMAYTSTVAPELVYFFYMMAMIMLVFFVAYYMFSPMYELITGKKFESKR